MAYAFDHEGKAFTPDGTLPAGTDVSTHNREVERQEIEHLKTHPDKAFLYCKMEQPDHFIGQPPYWARGTGTVHTWLGTVLDPKATFGARRQVGFGHHTYRRAVTCHLFGVRYTGWYMESSGDYCRLKRAKRQG